MDLTPEQIAAACDWAITHHLTGIPRTGRLAVCQRLVREYKLPFTGQQLLTWCHRHQTLDQARLAEGEKRGLVSLADLRRGGDGEDSDSAADLDVPDLPTVTEFTAARGEDRGEIIRQFAAVIDSTLHATTYGWSRATRRDKSLRRGAEVKSITGSGTLTHAGVQHTWTHGAVIISYDGHVSTVLPDCRVVRWPFHKGRAGCYIRVEYIGPLTITPQPAGQGGRPKKDPVRLNAERIGQAALAFFRRTMGGAADGQGTKQRRHYHDRQLAARIAAASAANNNTPPA